MPNGGVPMHMVLYPSDGSPYVLYLERGVLRVYERATWETEKSSGRPILVLTEAEDAALAWSVRYWLGDASRTRLNHAT